MHLRLLYSAFVKEGSGSKGVLNKLVGQCKAFAREISAVYLHVARKTESALYRIDQYGIEEIETFNYPEGILIYEGNSKLRKLTNYFGYNEFLKNNKKVIDHYNIDVLYQRISPPNRKLLNVMDSVKIPKILEIPTYPYENELKRSKTRLEYVTFWKRNSARLLNAFDYIVIISGNDDFNESEKFIRTSNGIQLDGIKIADQKEKDHFTLVSVANNAFWHGYDRIIKGLYEYYKNNPKKEAFYHCVGNGPELANLKKLTKELSLEKYIVFHGAKTGEELDKIFDESDIAFGSLGNHRKGLNSDSALKNREYCARGIPFVISSSDQDFPESFPYILKIPSDETPVGINEIVEWYEKLTHSHPNYSTEMRKYAEEHLSWDAKMKPVIEKIKEIAEEKGKNRS